jgi:hypothetical protein
MLIEIDVVFRIDSNSKLGFITFDSEFDFYSDVYVNVSIHKPLHILPTFNYNQFPKFKWFISIFVTAEPITS